MACEMALTQREVRAYPVPAAAHSAVGIGILNHRAHERSFEALFLRPSRYGGCHRGSSERGSLWPYANPMASATITIGIAGGGSQHTETIIMTAQSLIPVFAGEISGTTIQLVDARLLHAFLDVATKFADWIVRRIEEYGFVQDQDFLVSQIWETKSGRGGNRKAVTDYHLTLDMAKELAMVERNEKGRQARRYFIECERKLLAGAPYGLRELPEPPTRTALPGGLTREQQDCIKALVKDRVDELPQHLRAKAAITCWSAIKSKFHVATYKNVPQESFTLVCSLLARLPLAGELLEVRQVSTITVERQHLIDLYNDLGKLQNRADGLGMLKSDLPPSWWERMRIQK